jgi:two-component system cell cycle response regulator
MSPRAWYCYAGSGAAAVAAYFALPLLHAPAAVGVFWYFAISVSAAGALLLGALRHRPKRRFPWYLLAAGQALYAAADLLFYLERSVFGIDRYPFYDDVLYLAAYPVLAAGLIGFVRLRIPGWDLPSAIDSLVVSVAAALLMWVYLVSAIAFAPDVSALARTVSVAYPAMDLLLLTVVIRLSMGAGARSAAYRLIIGAFLLMFVADVGYGYLELTEAYVPGGVLELLWLLVVLALGSAGLHPSMTTLTNPARVRGPELSPSRFAALTLASITAPALLLVQQLLGADPHITAFAIACMLLFAFTLARMGTFALAHRRLADTDVLTGLRSRRYFGQALANATAGAHQDAVGLLLLDIDHFKKINDTYGHDGGDRVLVAIGALLRDSVRSADVAARYGGEEFAILLHDVSPRDLAANAERIRAAVASARISLASGQEVSVTVSIGGVSLNGRPGDAGETIRVADRRLYAAKDGGRNRAVLSDGEPAALTPARLAPV